MRRFTKMQTLPQFNFLPLSSIRKGEGQPKYSICLAATTKDLSAPEEQAKKANPVTG